MTKKVFIGILVSILLSLCTSFCFAATDTDKVNLGNDVSSSINKGMDSVGNAVRDVAGFGERTADDAGDAIGNMGNNNNARNNNSRTTNGINTNRMYNGNYNTTRTSADGAATTAGMSTTTWMWVIFAIAAVIIIAAIWYYAMQGNDRD